MLRKSRAVAFAVLLILWAGCFVVSQAEDAAKPVLIESMEFREVDIKDILRQLAKQFNLNIVFSESVRGLVTVQLIDVSIDQALDSIITVNGFAYTKKENVYKVTTLDEAEREGKQTKLFKLNNAEAPKLKDTLSKVLSSTGSIEADVRSNAIIVTDSSAVISKIESMIPALDEITPQVLIEAKFIETSLTNTEKLGIDWSTTIQAQAGKKPITFPFSPKGQGEWLDNASPNSSPSSTDISPSSYSFPYAVKGDFTLGTLDFSGLKIIMDFLKTRQNTKLVAAPRIMTTNNQKATINVGKVVPIATYQRNENTGAWEITGWEEQNIGINLEVTPQISPDGHVKLQLKPEVSNIIDNVGDSLNQRPVTSTRKAETEVQIKDGQTIVIGGLVKTKEARSSKKVPFLGDIPFLGKIFTRNERGTDEEPEEKTDLLIFVTAHIIKDGDGSVIAAENNSISRARPFKLQPRGKNAQ